jgi:prepilin-type processing-associated H-X9-DG protein
VSINPSREIIQQSLPPQSDPRVDLIRRKIVDRHFNTNYAASWFLVRTAAKLDVNGNLISTRAGCAPDLRARHSNWGPLTLAELDAAKAPHSAIPLLADAHPVQFTLPVDLGPVPAGAELARSMSSGPISLITMQPPTFAAGTPQLGSGGWCDTWLNETLQDYRAFAPLHGGVCNILFADGSVRAVSDTNGDGLLNNGFPANGSNGFADDHIELVTSEFLSWYSLRAVRID